MKKVIRLTESELKNIIVESVKTILAEEDFNRANHRQEDMENDFNDAEIHNGKGSSSMKAQLFPELGSEGNGEVYRMDAFTNDWRDNPKNEPNKVKAPYNSYVWNSKFSEHYPTPESFWDRKNTRAYKYTKDLDKIHRDEENFRKKQNKLTQKALDAADKRPLHRKGSLNRAFN